MRYSYMDEGSQTRYAREAFESFALDGYDGSELSYGHIIQMDEAKLFKEKLQDRMVSQDFIGTIDDTKEALKFLNHRCQKKGIDIEYNTLKNLILEGRVSQSVNARKNYYKLCFALNMTVEQTEEFFFKAILQKPFNYKDLYETVCYFCLTHRRPYSDVERLVIEIENTPKRGLRNIEETMLIADGVQRCKTEDELINYWINTHFEGKQNTAYKEVNTLIDSSMNRAIELGLLRKKNDNKLLSIIYGANFRKVKSGKPQYAQTFNKTDLPEAITRNFIQSVQLSNIRKGKASDDVLRKALILFGFFSFFADYAYLTDDDVVYEVDNPDVFLDFEEYLNEKLENCGYVGLYYRNPYDWMFGYCAKTIEPLCALPDLMERIYLDKYYTKP